MKKIKTENSMSNSFHSDKAWSRRIFNYSFSPENFIVPWQNDENIHQTKKKQKRVTKN